MTPMRLTSLAHGGGCGCKISPAMLHSILKTQQNFGPFPNLLIGNETSDDAAIYALDEENCIIATTDFFMPMVDDPKTFGQIAATNAVSDIYAMGGTPIMALALVGMPIDKLEPEIIAKILEGGQEVAAKCNIAVAGGHSIDCIEPLYGLSVIGLCKKNHIKRNNGAKAGDKLLLLKALGVGIYAAAFKKNHLPLEAYDEMIASMTKLNKIGADFGKDQNIHAMTDVTGFGLLGHGLEMLKGDDLNGDLSLEIIFSKIPLLSQTLNLSQAGFVTGASKRNLQSFHNNVIFPENFEKYKYDILTDPQTSGGLLLAVDKDMALDICQFAINHGYPHTAIIGEFHQNNGKIIIHP